MLDFEDLTHPKHENEEEIDDENDDDQENQRCTFSAKYSNSDCTLKKVSTGKNNRRDYAILAHLNNRITETKKLYNRIDELFQSADNPRTA